MGNKKKICYILPFYEEGTDTHLFYNYALIKKLAASPAEEAGREIGIFLIIEKKSNSDEKQLGVPCYVQKYKFPLFRFFELLFKCFSLRNQGYTNFYVHYSYYGALAAWLSSNFPISSRLTLKGSDATQKSKSLPSTKIFYWNRGMPWLFKRGWVEEKVFRFILQHTILVTGPESLAKEYQKHYGVRDYRILSNWVDVERFQASQTSAKENQSPENSGLAHSGLLALNPLSGGSDAHTHSGTRSPFSEFSGKRIILFVHHLSKRKGADLIPEIAKGFDDSVLFLMIGDGPEFENLKLEIENSGLKDRVRLLGRVPNADIVKYFHASNLFLMPSREEGSPHVILEAMAAGVPFVASDIGGIREIVPNPLEGYLCPTEDINCFRSKIKTLLSESELYSNARRECLLYAEKFDISRGVEEFIGLF